MLFEKIHQIVWYSHMIMIVQDKRVEICIFISGYNSYIYKYS